MEPASQLSKTVLQITFWAANTVALLPILAGRNLPQSEPAPPSAKQPTSSPMERPRGVTVLAYLYWLVALSSLFTFIPGQAFDPLQHPRLLAQSAASLLIAVTLGIALLKMKNWSRWLAITVAAAQLLSVLYAVAIAHSSITTGRVGLRTLFAVMVIWYLTRRRVKAAFQTA